MLYESESSIMTITCPAVGVPLTLDQRGCSEDFRQRLETTTLQFRRVTFRSTGNSGAAMLEESRPVSHPSQLTHVCHGLRGCSIPQRHDLHLQYFAPLSLHICPCRNKRTLIEGNLTSSYHGGFVMLTSDFACRGLHECITSSTTITG